MSQPAKAQEPSMEEILASIRRIIADDDTAKPAPPPAAVAPPPRPAAMPPRNPIPPSPPPAPRPVAPLPPPAAVMDQRDIDAILAAPHGDDAAPAEDVLELTEQMAEPAETPSFQTIDGQSDVIFTDAPPPEPRFVEEPLAVEEPPRRPQPAPQPAMADRTIMSSSFSSPSPPLAAIASSLS